jgi:putative ABC transport system ATP-binding protein
MKPCLEIQNLVKSFHTPEGVLRVLDGVTLTLNAGESLALTGESGSGKSTLLHIAATLEDMDTGDIRINTTALAGLSDWQKSALRRRDIGLVFQGFNLIPSLNVAQNIAFQARLAGRFDPAFCDDLALRLGLVGVKTRFPEGLSGGQQQRVAIARAIAPRPSLILADEPTGNLDETTADAVLDLLLDLTRETQAGLLMVTHSPRIAARLDRHLHLSQGRLAPVP